MPGQAHTLTSDIEYIVNDVSSDISAANSTLIEIHVKRTIIKFCEESQIWQEDVGPIAVKTGIDTYEISADREKAIVQVKKVFAKDDNGNLVEFAYGRDSASWCFYGESPMHIAVSPNDELTGKRLTVVAAIKPVMATGISFKFSTIINDDYFEAITAGTKARLYLAPGKPWSDPNLATYYQSIFDKAANEALIRAGRDFAKKPHRIQHKARTFY